MLVLVLYASFFLVPFLSYSPHLTFFCWLLACAGASSILPHPVVVFVTFCYPPCWNRPLHLSHRSPVLPSSFFSNWFNERRLGEQFGNITVYTISSIFIIIPYVYSVQVCDQRIKASPAFKLRDKHHRGPASPRLCHHHALPRGKGRLKSWLQKPYRQPFKGSGSMQGADKRVIYQK